MEEDRNLGNLLAIHDEFMDQDEFQTSTNSTHTVPQITTPLDDWVDEVPKSTGTYLPEQNIREPSRIVQEPASPFSVEIGWNIRTEHSYYEPSDMALLIDQLHPMSGTVQFETERISTENMEAGARNLQNEGDMTETEGLEDQLRKVAASVELDNGSSYEPIIKRPFSAC